MKQLKKLSLTLALLIAAVTSAWAGDTDPKVTTNAASAQDIFTTASFKMPASDVTVNYTLVRDMQDATNPVAFSGLPSSGNIIVKKGDDGKYQPAEALNIQLIDPVAAADAQNIIAADGITIKVLVGAVNGQGAIDYDQENPITLDAFLADMTPGYYWIKAEPTDENSPYDGTVYSSEFTVVEQYNLVVKPANDFSKGKIESVTVGTETVTPDATTGEAAKTGVAPDTEVKLKAKRGYIFEKVEVKKAGPATLAEATAEDMGKIVGADGKIYDTKVAAETAGTTAVAMIAYVGSETGHATYTHGLAIALANEGSMNWSTAKSTCEGKTAVTGTAWLLPSQSQWEAMFKANGGNETKYDGLYTAINTAKGTAFNYAQYWSSSENNPGNSAYAVDFGSGGSTNWSSEEESKNKYVRAALAF